MEIKAAASGKTQSKQLPVRSVAQPTLKEVIVQSQLYDTKGKKFAKLTKSIAYCIPKDSLPLQTLEQPGFKNMLNAFDSRYEIPSRNHFSRAALPLLCEGKVSRDLW